MNLRQWRESEGLSQKAAAEKCGVNQRTWESWEGRGNIPRPSAIAKIIKASGGKVTLEEVAKGPGAR